MRFRSGTNRYLCDVLDEMIACYKTRNFSPLEGLIEEARILGKRMEAGLDDIADADYMRKSIRALKKEIKELEDKKEKLEE